MSIDLKDKNKELKKEVATLKEQYDELYIDLTKATNKNKRLVKKIEKMEGNNDKRV